MYKSLILPLIATVLLHGTIIAILFFDWSGDSQFVIKKPPPKFIRAELVTLDKAKAPPKKVKKQPKVDTSAKREQEKKRKQEQQKKAQQKKEQEKKAQQKKEQERKKQQQLEQQQEQERLRKLEAERLQKQAEQEFADAIAEENALQESASDAELTASYVALITEQIQKNWSRPPSARNDMEAELVIQIVPTGDVVSVTVARSSGNQAFDRSAENAVLKAGRFPELQNLNSRVFERNFRRLRLKFRPEDLRL